jgi:hypothetical protein
VKTQTLLIIAVVAIAAYWLWCHKKHIEPWNIGQAGSIFQGGHGGGGQ